MKTKPKTIATFILASVLCGIFTAGCNTIRGVGRDVEKTGEHIQQGTR